TPRREHDGLPRTEAPSVDVNLELACDATAAADDRDVARFERRRLARVVEIVDDLVAAPEHRLHSELAGHRFRRTGNASPLRECVGGAEQRLGRHAAEERALAADEPVVDDSRGETLLAESAGTRLAGRTGADHDDVEQIVHETLLGRDKASFRVVAVLASS